MMADAKNIVITADGSSTILNTLLNQHYHSIHGAVQESLHVFMKMGWEVCSSVVGNVSILEIGFGTGLNAFLVLKECLKNVSQKCTYTSLEAFPLEAGNIAQLNYAGENERGMFQSLHDAEWNKEINIAGNFILHKIQKKLEEFFPGENKYDLIFFDAFSPEAQPELWTEEIFRKLFLSMKENGIFVTYCAKGQVRRNLKAAGFTVERVEGPPGKREMLRARKLPITNYRLPDYRMTDDE